MKLQTDKAKRSATWSQQGHAEGKNGQSNFSFTDGIRVETVSCNVPMIVKTLLILAVPCIAVVNKHHYGDPKG